MLPDSDRQNSLDEALRQQLSNYGEAPGPHVWAGVRRSLPGAPALRPRWRRPLPLLLLSLLPLLVATVIWLRPLPPKRLLTRAKPNISAPNSTATTGKAGTATAAGPTIPGALNGPASPAAATGAPAALAAIDHPSLADQLLGGVRPPARPSKGETAGDAPELSSRNSRPNSVAVTAPGRRLKAQRRQPAYTTFSRPEATPALTESWSRRAPQSAHPTPAGAVRAAVRAAVPAATPSSRSLETGSAATPLTVAAATAVTSDSESISSVAPAVDSTQATGAAAIARLPYGGLSSPAFLPLPAPLFALPEETAPAARPPRRWSLVAMAGPTLSYRTLRQPTTASGLEVARLERPAPGLGAQLQLRRVLNGRWALAAGLGYQEYATRLTLQVVTAAPVPSNATGSYTPAPLVGQAVQSRDTYRLLTLPAQLSYALGGSTGRWRVAALGGVEPGYYVGGSSTADNAYGIARSTAGLSSADFYSQRTYSAAGSSPYQTWNLGLSLGLELRYRPAPGSRWQVLAQPTGRYIATPFMRADAPDYSRQPFSVGLLVGLSWEL